LTQSQRRLRAGFLATTGCAAMPAIGSNTSLSLESPAHSTLAEDGTPALSPTPAALPSVAGTLTPGPRSSNQRLQTIWRYRESESGCHFGVNSSRTAMSLTEVANALEHHPDARPYHKLLALEVRARRDPALTDQYVGVHGAFRNAARLAQTYQGGADLADERSSPSLRGEQDWPACKDIGSAAGGARDPTAGLLPSIRERARRLQRWSEVKDLLMSEHSVVDPILQHMYLAVGAGASGLGNCRD